MKTPLFFALLLLLAPSLLHTLSPTLKDLVQDPVHFYRDPSSIPFDSIRPEDINTIGVEIIKSDSGDFNGDGINDLVVGTMRWDTGYNYYFYLVFGTEGKLPEYDAKQKIDEREGFQIFAKDSESFIVKDAGFIGDVNGDGLDDILVVVYGVSMNRERKSYIIYGSNKRLPSSVDPMESTKALLSDQFLDKNGRERPLLAFAGIGDFNGDGVDDFAIANDEKVSVAFGSKSLSSKVPSYANLQAETKEFTITAVNSESTCFAAKLTKAGDFNGDGLGDFMMSTKCDDGKPAGPSKVYVIYGQKTLPDTLPLTSLGSSQYPNSLIFDGGASGDFFGSRIAPIGDFNGDGFDDIMISSMSFSFLPSAKNNGVGGTYIFFGQKDLNGNMPHGILDARPELGVFIPGAGHEMAGIGDLNKDKYSDILISKDSNAYVIYGGPNFSGQFSLDKINGRNGFSITYYNHILDCVGVGDINGDSQREFVLKYGASKNSIITKDLPRVAACYNVQYCFTPEASKYMDSNFCSVESPASVPPVQKDNEESSSNNTTQAIVYSYNPVTQGVYYKATEHVVSKDSMSASTAALCGTAIGAGISAMIFLLGGAVRKWYKEGNYVQLEDQTGASIDWSLESCKVKIYEIEEAINKKFRCYKCLLTGLLGFEILTLIHSLVDMDAFDANFIVRFVLHAFKAFAFVKAIEAYKKGGLEKQKRVVLSMKILYGLGCVFLVLHTVALYQKVKPYWYLPETGLQFAGAVLFLAIFYIGTQLVVCLYAQKLLKLMSKREELREQLGNSRVDMQNREQESASAV